MTDKRRRLWTWTLRALASVALIVGTIVVGYALQTRLTLPDLRPWHTLHLREEFHAGRDDVRTLEDYRELEERLDAEVRARVLDDPTRADGYLLGRFHPGSAPARLALTTPYNRTYELAPPDPRGAVLLVHGLTDSPYSMRSLAETFFEQGYHVVVVRLPGHGTVPAALRDVTWHDWLAAVELAAKHAADLAGPGKPFLAGGYSAGAALITLYTMRAIEDPSLPRPKRLYLVSPAIGISGFAFLTNVISGLSFVPGLEKSEWVDVLPEYDPYKYNSFPVNAGKQMHRLTKELGAALAGAGEAGRLGEVPPIVAFMSLVDATVSAPDVISGLLGRLPPRGHELVVFDVNRNEALQGLLSSTALGHLERLQGAAELPFRVTLIANREGASTEIAAYTREAGERDVRVESLPLSWPPGLLSLGHVALPFPVDDPVYGLAPEDGPGPRFALGAFAARGESGALVVPLGMLARVRCNPFFEVVRSRVVETCCRD